LTFNAGIDPINVFLLRINFALDAVASGKTIGKCFVFQRKAVPLQADYYPNLLRV
jgi:hypothetical protein